MLVLDDCEDEQRGRILESIHDIRYIATRYRLSEGEWVHPRELERAFSVVWDIGEWNRCHPEEAIN